MKKTLATIFCASILIIGYTQMSEADSLRKVLAGTQKVTSRVWLFLKIAGSFEYSNPGTAMHYIQEAVKLAQQVHFERGGPAVWMKWPTCW